MAIFGRHFYTGSVVDRTARRLVLSLTLFWIVAVTGMMKILVDRVNMCVYIYIQHSPSPSTTPLSLSHQTMTCNFQSLMASNLTQMQDVSMNHCLVTESTQQNWAILPGHGTAQSSNGISQLKHDQGCNITFECYNYWTTIPQTVQDQTPTLDLVSALQTQENSLQIYDPHLINRVHAGYRQDAIEGCCEDSMVFVANFKHTSFYFETGRTSVAGDYSGVSAMGPSWLSWLLFGIGALLEFTILPGALSFVLSLDAFNHSPKIPTLQASNCPLSACATLIENCTDNSSSVADIVFSQDMSEEHRWSQTELMIRLIFDVLNSVSIYTTCIFKLPLRGMEGVAAREEEVTAILSVSGAASLLHEQMKMKRQCRLQFSPFHYQHHHSWQILYLHTLIHTCTYSHIHVHVRTHTYMYVLTSPMDLEILH